MEDFHARRFFARHGGGVEGVFAKNDGKGITGEHGASCCVHVGAAKSPPRRGRAVDARAVQQEVVQQDGLPGLCLQFYYVFGCGVFSFFLF